MTNLKTNVLSAEPFLSELTLIFKSNFCDDEKFQMELFKELSRATGNDNLGSLCREIINF